MLTPDTGLQHTRDPERGHTSLNKDPKSERIEGRDPRQGDKGDSRLHGAEDWEYDPDTGTPRKGRQ